jgi:nicotinate-nucleotide pyrophosphorylase (carboxylating)
MNLKNYLSATELDSTIDRALAEDIGHGDVTSEALIPREISGKASFLVKEKGVLAGIEVAGRVFQRVDPAMALNILLRDGAEIKPGDIAGTVNGSVISLLKAERVALNFLQRLSGIASTTAKYVAEIKGLNVKILDTRKTTPGLRSLEKYAVRAGGGSNHRKHLGDAVLIKDNHIAVLRATGMTLADIIAKAKHNAPEGMTIEVEVTNVQEAREAAVAGVNIIMLDNMSIPEMKKAVAAVAGRAKIEASGNITLANLKRVALTGVDFISVGALTHDIEALDISLELEEPFLKGMLA